MAAPDLAGLFKVDEPRLLSLLQDLIRIPSVNPSLVPGGNGEADIARFIGKLLDDMGLEVRYQELGENRANVTGILRGAGGGKSLMLNGHIDTVGPAGMSIHPFDPVYSDGKVLGRGSMDMKGGVAAMIGALLAIRQADVKLKGDVYLTFVADEEFASIGTEAIVREYKADAAIVCEPTGLSITAYHKGFVWLRVEVQGVAAHGSLPEEGVDAAVFGPSGEGAHSAYEAVDFASVVSAAKVLACAAALFCGIDGK